MLLDFYLVSDVCFMQLGSIPAELLKTVIQLGQVLLSVQVSLFWSKERSVSSLLTLIEEVRWSLLNVLMMELNRQIH